MALVIRGQVVGVEPTKGGNWSRIMVGSGRRVNDLVMVKADTGSKIKVGDALDLDVSAQVETNAEGRPTKNIVYWHRDGVAD